MLAMPFTYGRVAAYVDLWLFCAVVPACFNVATGNILAIGGCLGVLAMCAVGPKLRGGRARTWRAMPSATL